MQKRFISVVIALCVPLFVQAAATPQGSHYDSHMQQVSYNGQNSTIINTRAGYVSTLVFADDEAVISTQVGFIKGWTIDKEANRVYIRPAPITQPVTGEDGTTVQQAFSPESKDWKTNLFVTTTQHFYSLELNVLDDGTPANNLAFVVTWQYPDTTRKASADAQAARQKEWVQAQEKSRIATAFNQAEQPRNWDYAARVAVGSENIAPDFAYDDGHFTYLGFSPLKKIPGVFLLVNGKEQTTMPSFSQQGNYRVMVVHTLNPRLILRSGDAVVGIEDQGFGRVMASNGDTVSPAVELEKK
jgi:type IV secretion system protein VirB9